MKTIEAVSIEHNGVIKQAVVLECRIVSDNLKNIGSFYYAMYTAEGETLVQGNIPIVGVDYELWDSNEYAWSWVANKLSLTIIGDYLI